jgi:serine/threonine-protein kinase
VPEQFGDYVVHDQIAIGGMASVHLATSRRDGNQVALKRLLQHHADDPEQMRAFLDEGRLVTQLHHPNIATTFDCGTVNGTFYIAMEYVPGHTLKELVERCEQMSAARPLHGMIPFPITVAILIQLCDALEYAHTLRDAMGKPLGIIHRDISPANVILSSHGIVKLIDFGIAKATSQTVHSHVGTLKGKFSYMAPEYLKGTGMLDHRVDVWAIGVVAHELLTNRRLFKGVNDLETIYKVRADPIEPPSAQNPDVPRELDAIVIRALEREPSARWQSAGAIRAALAKAAHDLQILVTNDQLIEWVDWTFTEAPLEKRDELSQLIKLLETPRSTISKILTLESSQIVSIESLPPASASVPAEPLRVARPRPEPIRPAHTRPVYARTEPAGAASSRSTPLARTEVVPARKHRRKTSALRVFLLCLVLLAAGGFALWWYGMIPDDVLDQLSIPKH